MIIINIITLYFKHITYTLMMMSINGDPASNTNKSINCRNTYLTALNQHGNMLLINLESV